MASTPTTTERCYSCGGHGEVPTYRSHWVGGGKTGYRSEGVYDVRCEDCNGSGSSESAPITYCAQAVNAPGFEQSQFDRALLRAFCDDLRIQPHTQHDRWFVFHASSHHGYFVSRTSCTCRAGCNGVPCKHRAILVAHIDIRAPHIQRQWDAVNRERPARAQTAA